MGTKVADAVAENIILVFWLLVCLAFILAAGQAGEWLEAGKYVVGQHLINSGLNSPLGQGLSGRPSGVAGSPIQVKG